MDARARLSLAPLAAAAASGRAEAVRAAARAARAAGASATEVREALLLVVPFCGYPRALDALAAAGAAIGAAPGHGDRPSRERGAAFFDLVYGEDARRVRDALAATDAEVARWIEEDAYAKVLSRPNLDAATRELVAVVLLAAQGLRNQLKGHARGAIRCGASREDLAAFLDAASPHLPGDELAFARGLVASL